MWIVRINETQIDCFQTLKVKLCAFTPLILNTLRFQKTHCLVGKLLVIGTFYKCQYMKTSQWWADSITKYIKNINLFTTTINQAINFHFYQT